MSLIDFLNSCLESSFVLVVVAFAGSFLLEMWPAFGDLSAQSKKFFTMGLSFAVPLLATAALYGQGLTTDRLWTALVAGFVAYFGTQAGHGVIIGGKVTAEVRPLAFVSEPPLNWTPAPSSLLEPEAPTVSNVPPASTTFVVAPSGADVARTVTYAALQAPPAPPNETTS